MKSQGLLAEHLILTSYYAPIRPEVLAWSQHFVITVVLVGKDGLRVRSTDVAKNGCSWRGEAHSRTLQSGRSRVSILGWRES